jgi:hypothetical protein
MRRWDSRTGCSPVVPCCRYLHGCCQICAPPPPAPARARPRRRDQRRPGWQIARNSSVFADTEGQPSAFCAMYPGGAVTGAVTARLASDRPYDTVTGAVTEGPPYSTAPGESHERGRGSHAGGAPLAPSLAARRSRATSSASPRPWPRSACGPAARPAPSSRTSRTWARTPATTMPRSWSGADGRAQGAEPRRAAQSRTGPTGPAAHQELRGRVLGGGEDVALVMREMIIPIVLGRLRRERGRDQLADHLIGPRMRLFHPHRAALSDQRVSRVLQRACMAGPAVLLEPQRGSTASFLGQILWQPAPRHRTGAALPTRPG